MDSPANRTRARPRVATSDGFGRGEQTEHRNLCSRWLAGLWGPLVVYGAMSLVAIATALARLESPFAADPWLPFLGTAVARHLASVMGGIALALVTVKSTRAVVGKWAWARDLHNELRVTVRHVEITNLVVLGIASAMSEELFFRGLLANSVGLVASSLAFGLIHQRRGRARWIWSGWATLMGCLFGSLFFLTGSLLGPVVAHALINVTNLKFLRDTDLEAKPARKLGGLLNRR